MLLNRRDCLGFRLYNNLNTNYIRRLFTGYSRFSCIFNLFNENRRGSWKKTTC